MKKNLGWCLKNILLTTVGFFAAFALFFLLLKALKLRFRIWVIKTVLFVTIVGGIAGFIQIIHRMKDKLYRVLLIIALAAVVFIFGPIAGLFGIILTYSTEEVVTRGGQKYLASREEFLDTIVYYYEYINPVISGGTELIVEHHGASMGNYTAQYYDSESDSYKYVDRGNNIYFYQIFSDEYDYDATAFLGEKPGKVKVGLTLLSKSDKDSVYSVDIIHDDLPGRYIRGDTDKYNIGTFYVSDNEFYLLLNYQGKEAPTKEVFVERGINLDSYKEDMTEIADFQVSINSEGYDKICRITGKLSGEEFSAEYRFEKFVGLTYYLADYGKEGGRIEIYR